MSRPDDRAHMVRLLAYAEADVQRLTIEVKRLREALERIAFDTATISHECEIARAVLEQKP